MTQQQAKTTESKYSSFFSGLFSSLSIIVLTILCLLNNPSFDLYSSFRLFKVVIPGSLFCWYFGFIIGKIFDKSFLLIDKKIIATNSKEAYEMPSMFAAAPEESSIDIENVEI